ncbi:hypothetical protein Hanom_Chr06g00497041 [Helianthus anomalus]
MSKWYRTEFIELKDFQYQFGTNLWRFLYKAGAGFYLHVQIPDRTVPVFSIPVDTKLIPTRNTKK